MDKKHQEELWNKLEQLVTANGAQHKGMRHRVSRRVERHKSGRTSMLPNTEEGKVLLAQMAQAREDGWEKYV